MTTYSSEAYIGRKLKSLNNLRPIDSTNFWNWRNKADGKNLPSLCHIVIDMEYEGRRWIVDSTGAHPMTKQAKEFGGYPILRGALTLEELEAFVADKKVWNDDFPRRQIPKIKKDIAQFFGVYVFNGIEYVPAYTPPKPKKKKNSDKMIPFPHFWEDMHPFC
jgi:hypothetical protein